MNCDVYTSILALYVLLNGHEEMTMKLNNFFMTRRKIVH